jgi:hypothetical protein
MDLWAECVEKCSYGIFKDSVIIYLFITCNKICLIFSAFINYYFI